GSSPVGASSKAGCTELRIRCVSEPCPLVDFFLVGGMETATSLLFTLSILGILRVSFLVTLVPRQHVIFRMPDPATRPLLFSCLRSGPSSRGRFVSVGAKPALLAWFGRRFRIALGSGDRCALRLRIATWLGGGRAGLIGLLLQAIEGEAM